MQKIWPPIRNELEKDLRLDSERTFYIAIKYYPLTPPPAVGNEPPV
jgi:hypothetical protein